ncbi:MAG: PQQ-like beta-propeller repeat protein [Lentisphaeraceae bacterium]|nr:PQQ-like beta-propeller repeat protein [Lentisphaeraceae bacterium]
MNKVYVLFTLLFTSVLTAADWPQFLGPNGNDITTADSSFDPDLTKWKKSWEVKIGVGYSAVAVEGDYAYTMGHDAKDTESVYCIDTKTGKTVWQHEYKGQLVNKLHFGGPNATPTVEGAFVYTAGKDGKAFCLDKKDGKVIWKKGLLATMGIPLPNFGIAGSPLIYQDWVIYTSGRALALNKKDGKVVWVSKVSEPGESAYHPGHATPVVFTHSGKDYLAYFIGTGLEVLNMNDGSFVARYNVNADYNMTATTPIILNDGKNILLSWNKYSEMLNFNGKSLSKKWKTSKFIHTMQNTVLVDGILYGTHGNNASKRTSMMAIDPETGKALWDAKFPWAQITVIGDTLLCQGIKGNLITVKINKSKFEEISRIKTLDNICWTKATYAGGKIFVRNDKGRLLCFSL